MRQDQTISLFVGKSQTYPVDMAMTLLEYYKVKYSELQKRVEEEKNRRQASALGEFEEEKNLRVQVAETSERLTNLSARLTQLRLNGLLREREKAAISHACNEELNDMIKILLLQHTQRSQMYSSLLTAAVQTRANRNTYQQDTEEREHLPGIPMQSMEPIHSLPRATTPCALPYLSPDVPLGGNDRFRPSSGQEASADCELSTALALVQQITDAVKFCDTGDPFVAGDIHSEQQLLQNLHSNSSAASPRKRQRQREQYSNLPCSSSGSPHTQAGMSPVRNDVKEWPETGCTKQCGAKYQFPGSGSNWRGKKRAKRHSCVHKRCCEYPTHARQHVNDFPSKHRHLLPSPIHVPPFASPPLQRPHFCHNFPLSRRHGQNVHHWVLRGPSVHSSSSEYSMEDELRASECKLSLLGIEARSHQEAFCPPNSHPSSLANCASTSTERARAADKDAVNPQLARQVASRIVDYISAGESSPLQAPWAHATSLAMPDSFESSSLSSADPSLHADGERLSRLIKPSPDKALSSDRTMPTYRPLSWRTTSSVCIPPHPKKENSVVFNPAVHVLPPQQKLKRSLTTMMYIQPKDDNQEEGAVCSAGPTRQIKEFSPRSEGVRPLPEITEVCSSCASPDTSPAPASDSRRNCIQCRTQSSNERFRHESGHQASPKYSRREVEQINREYHDVFRAKTSTDPLSYRQIHRVIDKMRFAQPSKPLLGNVERQI